MKATFGAGCFWHVEEAFRKIKGVTKTTAGFMGGDVKNPGYEQVCTGKTGHAEVVQLEYDPDVVSYDELLDVFFRIHDPTQLNRQGFDVGSQYRSVIYFHNEKQKIIAEKAKKELIKKGKKVVTGIRPAEEFYEAEEYHQKYLMKNKGWRFWKK